MYIAHIFIAAMISSWLSVIVSGTEFRKGNQSPPITNLTEISIPPGTTQIFIHTNAISHVPANYFTNLSNLITIFLFNNLIHDIADYSFVGVPSVKTINLGLNKLSAVREHQFSGLIHLHTLDLKHNEIHTVQDNSFKDLTSLTSLNLCHNNLKNLSRSIFDKTDHQDNLNHFDMSRNPLQCNTLCWLIQEEQKEWITVISRSTTTCDGPAILNGKTWDSSLIEYRCPAVG